MGPKKKVPKEENLDDCKWFQEKWAKIGANKKRGLYEKAASGSKNNGPKWFSTITKAK